MLKEFQELTIASNEYRVDMPSPTDLSSTNLLDRWRDVDYSRRRYRRWRINEKAVVKYSGAAHDCLVRDISPGGASIEIDSEKALAVNDRINFELDGYDPLYSEVRHITDGRLGIVFPIDDQAQLAFAEWLTLVEFSRRRYRRKSIQCSVVLHIGERDLKGVTQNNSLGGAKIDLETDAPLELGVAATLEVEDLEAIPGHIQRKLGRSIGNRFDHIPATQRALQEWLRHTSSSHHPRRP